MDISINYDQSAQIRVIGVGGGGGNAVQSMIADNLKGVSFIAANTDVQALAKSNAETKIQLGKELTKGLGAGAKPEVGKSAAEESIEDIREAIGVADMVFITAGMGGGTGTGAAPVIAKVAKERGALTVGVVTKPFHFEGARRMRASEQGINELTEHVDSLIVIPNNRLLSSGAKNAKMTDMFKKVNDVLYCAVRGITDLITSPGFINADFADVKTVMSERGMALMGIGKASGEHRAIEAAKAAITSSLLEDISVQGAKAVLVNVTATSDILMSEYEEANTYIADLVGENANIIAAIAVDEDAGEELTVTVIATGLEQNPQSLGAPQAVAAPVQPTKTIEYATQQPQQPQHRSQTLAQLNQSAHPYGMNESDPNIPAYLRNRLKQQKRAHTPGADEFLFSEDETELPTFIHRQAN